MFKKPETLEISFIESSDGLYRVTIEFKKKEYWFYLNLPQKGPTTTWLCNHFVATNLGTLVNITQRYEFGKCMIDADSLFAGDSVVSIQKGIALVDDKIFITYEKGSLKWLTISNNKYIVDKKVLK